MHLCFLQLFPSHELPTNPNKEKERLVGNSVCTDNSVIYFIQYNQRFIQVTKVLVHLAAGGGTKEMLAPCASSVPKHHKQFPTMVAK